MHRTATLATALVAVVAFLAVLAQPAAAAETQNRRWAVNGQSYHHYGNPRLGEIRSDTWVDEQYAVSDIGTEPYLFWRVRAVSRVVKVSRAVRVQVDVTRVEDVRGHVFARNASPVNSGSASYAMQVSPWADVSPYEFCLEFATHSPLRVRTLFSIRWSDGTLGQVTRVGPWTDADGGPQWCYP
jgi:hypothetical protein